SGPAARRRNPWSWVKHGACRGGVAQPLADLGTPWRTYRSPCPRLAQAAQLPDSETLAPHACVELATERLDQRQYALRAIGSPAADAAVVVMVQRVAVGFVSHLSHPSCDLTARRESLREAATAGGTPPRTRHDDPTFTRGPRGRYAAARELCRGRSLDRQ